jgi:hypothetical protein
VSEINIRRGMEWLIAAADSPQDCRKAWTADPRTPYPVPTGDTFDVISVDLRLGLEAADLLRRRRMPLPPIALDYFTRRAEFIVPTDSLRVFDRQVHMETLHAPSYRYVGERSYVLLPGPEALASDRHQWLISPPRRPVTGAKHATALALMLVAAAELLERADRFGQMFSPTAPVATETAADGAEFIHAVDTALKRMATHHAD